MSLRCIFWGALIGKLSTLFLIRISPCHEAIFSWVISTPGCNKNVFIFSKIYFLIVVYSYIQTLRENPSAFESVEVKLKKCFYPIYLHFVFVVAFAIIMWQLRNTVHLTWITSKVKSLYSRLCDKITSKVCKLELWYKCSPTFMTYITL